jgi:hypothetical protein
MVSGAPLGVGALLAVFAWSRYMPLSLLLLAAMGGCIMIAVNTTNALLHAANTVLVFLVLLFWRLFLLLFLVLFSLLFLPPFSVLS